MKNGKWKMQKSGVRAYEAGHVEKVILSAHIYT